MKDIDVAQLRALYRAMPAARRDRWVWGMTTRMTETEVADALVLPVGTVRAHAARGLQASQPPPVVLIQAIAPLVERRAGTDRRTQDVRFSRRS